MDTVQLNPKPAQTLRLGVQHQDLVLKNSKPVIVDNLGERSAHSLAQFTARDTSLEVAAAISFDPKTGADLTVRGSMNLIILQLLNPDLVAAATRRCRRRFADR